MSLFGPSLQEPAHGPRFARRCLLSLIALVVSSAPVAFAQSSVVVWQNGVWNIDLKGDVRRFPYDFHNGPEYSASLQGVTGPLVSSDQKAIGFTRENDLWILELATMQAKRVTKLGRSYTKEFASVFVEITAWSADSRRILYHVASGEVEDVDGDAPPRKVRPVPYGFHIYELSTGKSTPAYMSGEYQAWLPNGDFLVKEGEFQNARLVRVRPGEKSGTALPINPGDYSQVHLGPDGREMLAFVGDTKRGAEIVRIDIAAGNLTSLAKGKWAEFQRPGFSPCGSHFSYVRQFPNDERGRYGNELFIDGRLVYRSGLSFTYYWIDEGTLALLVHDWSVPQKHTWIVIDHETGKEKSSTPMS
jgi:hypothetical protein